MGAGRVVVVAAEVWLLTTVAHAVGGGGLPSLPWLLGLGGLVVVATAGVLRSRVSPWLVAGGLAAVQLGLHVALGAASSGSASHAGMAMSGHAHQHATLTSPAATGLLDSVTTRMVLAHVLCALVTGFIWWLRRRVVAEVLRLGRLAPTVVRRRTVLLRAAVATRPHGRLWLLGDPGRAPPQALVAA